MLTETPDLNQINHCAKQLIDKGLTLALAESATAGRICAELALAKDAGKFLRGCLACYDAEVKKKILKVDAALIEQFTPESAEVSKAITVGLPLLFDADIYVGCTGLSCPGGSETDEKPVGTMFFHACYKDQTIFAERAVFSGTQNQIVVSAVNHLVNLLIAYLKLAPEANYPTLDKSKDDGLSNRPPISNHDDQWSVTWP